MRVYAEDPVRFLPGPGAITRYEEPSGDGIRVDSGYTGGDVVTPHYDPLLAKLLAVGPDRATALTRLRAAVKAFEAGGVQTTLPFHRWLLDQDDFTAARGLSTELVDHNWQPAPIVQKAALVAVDLALTASLEPPPLPPASEPSAAAWWRAGIDAELEHRL